MSVNRQADWVAHIWQAAGDACQFVQHMDKEAFFGDRRTQRAVVMSLIIVVEAATKLMEHYPDFTTAHPLVPWRSMRGMPNRIAHGYFDIDLDVVWETLQSALPALLQQLPAAAPDSQE
jgi:uncharacterized protein with HEPN domain